MSILRYYLMQRAAFSVTIIDDDETAHFIIKAFIKLANPEAIVNSFMNPLQFLVACRDAKFTTDGILLDINMPHMNGWELLQELKPKNFATPIYVLSSSTDSRDIERVNDFSSVMGYIIKPLTLERIKQILSNFAAISNRLK